MVFNATLINIWVISWPLGFIGGGNWSIWRKPPTCRKSLNALIEIQTRRRLWSRPECGYSDNVCFRSNSVLVALFLVYKFPLMSHLCPQYQMVIFANAPKSSSICTFFIFKVIDMPFSFAVSKSFYIFRVIFITLSALVNLIFLLFESHSPFLFSTCLTN